MKLNLGCGDKILNGFVNLDKYPTFNPDIVHDLEKFPYPFDTSSVNEIVLNHVLEHLGKEPEVFNQIIRELYRISQNGCIIKITVPHPRHDFFLADPTHVRPIIPLTLALFDKEKNIEWQKNGNANTPLAIIHNVNFKIVNVRYDVDKFYINKIKEKEITLEMINLLAREKLNVIHQIYIELKVIK